MDLLMPGFPYLQVLYLCDPFALKMQHVVEFGAAHISASVDVSLGSDFAGLAS